MNLNPFLGILKILPNWSVTFDGLGIGNCCRGASQCVKGCPPTAEAIANALEECLQDEALLKSLADLGIEVNFKNTADAQAQVASYADIIKNALIAGGALGA